MLSASSSVASQPRATYKSVLRFAELVNKIETSPASSSKKRINAARRKLSRVIREQKRYAKTTNLRAVALTLTYRDAASFSSKHISAFIDCLRRALKRKGHSLPYAWVVERANHLHYHCILWLPRDYVLAPTQLARQWAWGSTWVESCRSVKAWGRYIAKFDRKERLPKGARLYGYGGLDDAARLAVSRANLPRWLLALLPTNHRARRCQGGGWVDITTGEIHNSPYIWTPRGVVLAVVSPSTYPKPA